jgi:hypothetical protein
VRILNHKTPDICIPLFFIKLKKNKSGSFSHVLIKLIKGEGQKSKTGGEQVISHTKYFTKALHKKKNRRPWNFFLLESFPKNQSKLFLSYKEQVK